MKWLFLLLVVGCAATTEEGRRAGVRRQAEWYAENECIRGVPQFKADRDACKAEVTRYCVSEGLEATCWAGTWTQEHH